MGTMLGEARLDNMVKEIDNVGVKIVDTMFEEPALEVFLISCFANAHTFDCSLDVFFWRKYGKKVGGSVDEVRGLLRDIV